MEKPRLDGKNFYSVCFFIKQKKNTFFLQEGLASQKNALIIRSPKRRKRC
ncbi:hypothetical protein VINE108274_02985 [Vibrio neptunius]